MYLIVSFRSRQVVHQTHFRLSVGYTTIEVTLEIDYTAKMTTQWYINYQRIDWSRPFLLDTLSHFHVTTKFSFLPLALIIKICVQKYIIMCQGWEPIWRRLEDIERETMHTYTRGKPLGNLTLKDVNWHYLFVCCLMAHQHYLGH